MKTIVEKRWYATKRVSKAVDRQITSSSPEEKAKAELWISAWARKAGLK